MAQKNRKSYPTTKSKCLVTTCNNSSDIHPELSYFGLPIDLIRRRKWLELIGRHELLDILEQLTTNHKVCEKHFPSDVKIFFKKRRLLNKTALPSLFLPQSEILEENKDEKIESTHSGQTNDSVASELAHREIMNSIEKITKPKINVKYGKRRKINKDNVGSKKTNENNILLDLYKASPQAYFLFQEGCRLPLTTTIIKQYLQVGSEITESVMMILKTRVDRMTIRERNCSVLIGYTKLKANLCYNIKKDKIIGFQDIDCIQSPNPAARGLVVMIRGLFSNWKQPVCCALASADNTNNEIIDSWIDKIIKSLLTIGLNVRTVISAVDDGLLKVSRATSDLVGTPYLIVNDKKIYYIFDAPKLIRSVRDSMLLNEFHFHGHIAKHEHIVKFYNADQNKSKPLAEKLTNKHVNPTSTEKEQTEYAIQLLSETVASGLWNYINFKLIDEEAKDTVEFITNINNLFNLLNSCNRTHEDNNYKKAYCGDETQRAFLEEMLEYFQNIKVVNIKNGLDVTSTTRFLKGFLITIKSIILLFDDLNNEGHRFLPTKNLHQDIMDKFLKQMAPTKLTSHNFTQAFRKSIRPYLAKFTQEGCSKGVLRNFLEQMYTPKKYDLVNTHHSETPTSIKKGFEDDFKIIKIDYDKIDTPDKHSLSYICQYLLNKSREKHENCNFLMHYTCDTTAPGDNFVHFVEQMDEKFLEAFDKPHLDQRIAESVYNEIVKKLWFSAPCLCFPQAYIVKLFVRIKIFYTIRTNNVQLRTNKRNGRYFSVPKLCRKFETV